MAANSDSDVVVCAVCGQRNRVPAAVEGVPHCGRCGAALPWIVDAGSDDYDQVVKTATIPVLVDLWAPWCGPCRVVSPALERLAHEHAGRVKLVRVDVDEAPDVAERYDVRGIPTLLVLDRAQVVARQTGAPPEPALAQWLGHALSAAGHPAPEPA